MEYGAIFPCESDSCIVVVELEVGGVGGGASARVGCQHVKERREAEAEMTTRAKAV